MTTLLELLAWAGVLILTAAAAGRLRVTVLERRRVVPASLPLTDGSLPVIPPLDTGEAGSGAGRARPALELILGGASPAPYEHDSHADNYGAW